MTEIITAMFTLLSGIIFPATVTPISALAAFGLLFAVVLTVLSLIKRLSSLGGG